MSVSANDKRTWGLGREEGSVLARWSGCRPAQVGKKGIWLEGPTWQLEHRSWKGAHSQGKYTPLTPNVSWPIASPVWSFITVCLWSRNICNVLLPVTLKALESGTDKVLHFRRVCVCRDGNR